MALGYIEAGCPPRIAAVYQPRKWQSPAPRAGRPAGIPGIRTCAGQQQQLGYMQNEAFSETAPAHLLALLPREAQGLCSLPSHAGGLIIHSPCLHIVCPLDLAVVQGTQHSRPLKEVPQDLGIVMPCIRHVMATEAAVGSTASACGHAAMPAEGMDAVLPVWETLCQRCSSCFCGLQWASEALPRLLAD